MLAFAEKLIKHHEGFREKVYLCTAGKSTVGYGRNLDDVGISREEGEHLLLNDINRVVEDLQGFPWFKGLSQSRQAALVDMRYCLGGTGFRKFYKMIAALEAGDYLEAAEQILDSKFAGDVGQRAIDLHDLMVAG